MIVWDTEARTTFKKQIKRISEDSLQSAIMVRDDIFEIVRKIPENPEKFPLDKFKANNDGTYRAFEKHSLRIACFISDHIRILRVRHVKQEPKKY